MSQAAVTHEDQPTGFLSNASETQRNVIIWGTIVLGGLAVGGLGYLIVRGAIRKGKDKKESRKGLDDREPASYAKRLRKAVQGGGTTEEAIRLVFREIRDGEDNWNFYQKVQKSYEHQYQEVLEDRLESELQETEWDEIRAIINEMRYPKGVITKERLTSWVKRLRAAWDVTCWIFSCTDEDAALSVLRDVRAMNEPRRALQELEKLYRRTYFIDLHEEADSEMDGYYWDQWDSLRNDIMNTRVA